MAQQNAPIRSHQTLGYDTPNVLISYNILTNNFQFATLILELVSNNFSKNQERRTEVGEIRNRFTGQVIFTYEGELRKVNLRRVNLRGADLRWANLLCADLREVDLLDADLRWANLRWANLRKAKNIPQHYIDRCHNDFVRTVNLLTQNGEVKYLKKCLMKGEISGTQYRGECACLVGSIANFQKKDISDLCFNKYEYGVDNPAEQWFWQIQIGDTPKNSFFAQKAVEWCDELLK